MENHNNYNNNQNTRNWNETNKKTEENLAPDIRMRKATEQNQTKWLQINKTNEKMNERNKKKKKMRSKNMMAKWSGAIRVLYAGQWEWMHK